MVDASTLDKKVMAGYQGWFMTGNDGSGAGWRHWAGQTPNASNITFDMWPDMRELSPSELEAEADVNRHDVEKQITLFQALVSTNFKQSYEVVISRWEKMCEFVRAMSCALLPYY